MKVETEDGGLSVYNWKSQGFFLFCFVIYLFGCAGSWLQRVATLELWPSALRAQSLSHWTIREVPKSQGLNRGSLDSKAYAVPKDGEQGRDMGCPAQSRETCCLAGSSLLIPVTLQCSFHVGIKDYSNWPTIPQVYLNGEFVGGCDILLQMHQNGDLVEELKKLGIRSALLDEAKDQDSK